MCDPFTEITFIREEASSCINMMALMKVIL